MAVWRLLPEPKDGLCPQCKADPEERDYPDLIPPARFRDCPECRITWEVDKPRRYHAHREEPPPRAIVMQPPRLYPPLATKDHP